jgi:raffinose/stachyose/melibiose transport system permease protein
MAGVIGRAVKVSARIYLGLLIVIALAPLLVLLNVALKPQAEFMVNQFGWPSHLTLDNLAGAWTDGDYLQAYSNSLVIGLSVIAIICVGGGLCAYALARMDFRGKNLALIWLFVSLAVPLNLFLVPLFYVYQKVGLMNTRLGLILIYSGVFLPFNVLLLRSYFLGIPPELAESARIDGAGDMQTLLRIYVPLARPAFLTVALLAFLWSWNEFFFANAFIQSTDLQTVALKYLTFSGDYVSNWSYIMAGGIITIAPMVALYLILQRRFIEGLTEGGLKG